jgi:hypothetical protein
VVEEEEREEVADDKIRLFALRWSSFPSYNTNQFKFWKKKRENKFKENITKQKKVTYFED